MTSEDIWDICVAPLSTGFEVSESHLQNPFKILSPRFKGLRNKAEPKFENVSWKYLGAKSEAYGKPWRRMLDAQKGAQAGMPTVVPAASMPSARFLCTNSLNYSSAPATAGALIQWVCVRPSYQAWSWVCFPYLSILHYPIKCRKFNLKESYIILKKLSFRTKSQWTHLCNASILLKIATLNGRRGKTYFKSKSGDLYMCMYGLW